MAPKTFNVIDTTDEFMAQGHNPRTRNAWDCGVRLRVKGKQAGTYRGSHADFADAELAGWRYADTLLGQGFTYTCHECGSVSRTAVSSVSRAAVK